MDWTMNEMIMIIGIIVSVLGVGCVLVVLAYELFESAIHEYKLYRKRKYWAMRKKEWRQEWL